MRTRTTIIACVTVGLLLGFSCASMYYYPAYRDVEMQRNDISQDLCNANYNIDGLNTRLSSSESELSDLKVGYNKIVDDRNKLSCEYASLNERYNNQSGELVYIRNVSYSQKLQIDRIGAMMQESYNKGYVDGSSGDSSNDDFIWDLIKGGVWLFL